MSENNGHLPIIGRAWHPSTREPGPLLPATRLALANWVRPDGLARRELVLGAAEGEPWEVMTIDSESAEQAWRVIHLLDGKRTLADIAKETRLDLALVSSVAQDLYHRAVLVQTSGLEVDALTYYEHLRSLAGIAQQRWGPSSMLRRFWTGPVSRRLAVGYLLENYHFAAAASSHQSAAVASQPTERLKTILSEHLSFEYWHHAWLKRGLLAAGLTEADLEQASPLISMQALINHLRWLGMADPLSYSACIGVGEGDPTALATVGKFWERFTEHGVLPVEAFGPFRDHDIGDCSDDHDQFGREPFADAGPLTAADQARIRRRLITFCRLTMAYHRELLDFYGPEQGPTVFSVED